MDALWTRFTDWAASHTPSLLRVVLIPLAAFVLVRVASALIHRIELLAEDDDPTTLNDREKRARTLGRILRQFVAVLVWTVTAMLVLGELGVDLKPILAGAGVVGLAIGFGAQTLVKDLISGFFLLLENQVRVNDVVTVGDASGLVEAMNLRTMVLRDLDGRVHIIPNGAISILTNHTREWARAVLDVSVGFDEDTDRCVKILREVGASLEQDPQFRPKLIGSVECPGIEQIGESAIALRIMVRTLPTEQWGVLRELRRRIKQAFAAAGIDLPYRRINVTIADRAEERRTAPAPDKPA